MFEVLKHCISYSLSPLTISLALMLFGWLLIYRGRQRAGLRFLFTGGIVLLLGSVPAWTYAANQRMEYIHQPLLASQSQQPETGGMGDPQAIVVLGTGFNPDPQLPVHDRVDGHFLHRFLEGVRLGRLSPELPLIVSVAGDAEPSEKREFVTELSNLMNFDAERIELIDDAESTEDEATAVADRFGLQRVMVVTSAFHVPRMLQTFENQDITVIPAPTAFNYPRPGSEVDKKWKQFLPGPGGFGSNHRWIQEKVATLWQSIKG